MELKDKVVVITGAAGGIGSHIALAFVEKGAKIALVDRSQELCVPVAQKIEDKNGRAVTVVADVTREEDISRIVTETEQTLGPIDILVNNAGIMPFKKIVDHTDKDVLNSLMVNVYGPIRLAQTVLKGMLERDSGRIVNIGSIFGSLAFPFFGVYSATKSAIRSFSEALRRELQDTGVGVTYVAPRATRTSQSPIFFEMAEKAGMNFDDPTKVAATVVSAVEGNKAEVFIGGPEKFFIFINKFKPSMVDKGLKKQMAVMEEYAPKVNG